MLYFLGMKPTLDFSYVVFWLQNPLYLSLCPFILLQLEIILVVVMVPSRLPPISLLKDRLEIFSVLWYKRMTFISLIEVLMSQILCCGKIGDEMMAKVVSNGVRMTNLGMCLCLAENCWDARMCICKYWKCKYRKLGWNEGNDLGLYSNVLSLNVYLKVLYIMMSTRKWNYSCEIFYTY